MKTFRHLFQITPGARLEPARGLRTAVAFLLALLVSVVFGRSAFGGAAGLGFLLGMLFTSFCDFGPSVRMRAAAMSAITIGGPLVVAVGRSLAPPWWLAGTGSRSGRQHSPIPQPK